MPIVLAIVTWLVIAAYCFSLSSRAERSRDRRGLWLVGTAALLVAAICVTPKGGEHVSPGDIFVLLAAVLSAAMVVTGLVLAFPEELRRPNTRAPLPPDE